jgi:hypothetical protein
MGSRRRSLSARMLQPGRARPSPRGGTLPDRCTLAIAGPAGLYLFDYLTDSKPLVSVWGDISTRLETSRRGITTVLALCGNARAINDTHGL